jgi:hypothetical protein
MKLQLLMNQNKSDEAAELHKSLRSRATSANQPLVPLFYVSDAHEWS